MSYGLYGSAGFNYWSIDLNRFGFLSASDPHNAKSTEFGGAVGLFADIPISRKFSLSMKTGLLIGKANLENEYSISKTIDGQTVSERALHEVVTDALSLTFEPALKFRLLPYLSVYGGFGLAFRFNNESNYYKTIYEYSGAEPEHAIGERYVLKALNVDNKLTLGFIFSFGVGFKPYFLGTGDWLEIEAGYSAGYFDLGEEYPLDYGALKFTVAISVSELFTGRNVNTSMKPPSPSDEKRYPVRDSVVEIVKPINK
jgi:hypothetical protein